MLALEKERAGKEKSFYELCLKVLKGVNLSLYDLEYIGSSQTLKIFIVNDETNTAKLEECVVVDRAFSPYFESEEWIPEGVTLEVSSPGMYRKLRSLKHFKSVIKNYVEVVLNREFGKIDSFKSETLSKTIQKSRKVRGILTSVDEQGINLEIDSCIEFISFEFIKNANLSPDINY